MASMTTIPEELDLKAGPGWSSFEQLRTQGAKALDSVRGGAIATLQTKTGQYRILAESDFQALLGLARDMERLRGGLRVVAKAVRVVQNHPNSDSLSLLSEAVAMLGELPELPARDSFTPLAPEELKMDSDDAVILAPAQIERQLKSSARLTAQVRSESSFEYSKRSTSKLDPTESQAKALVGRNEQVAYFYANNSTSD